MECADFEAARREADLLVDETSIDPGNEHINASLEDPGNKHSRIPATSTETSIDPHNKHRRTSS